MSPHQAKFNNSHEAGFTLVEALVALVLLTTALVPTFILASDAVKLSVSIRNTITAAGLAQEGVEVVRAMRDANWFNAQPFDSGLDSCGTGVSCLVQWDWTAPQALAGNPPLRWDASSGLYQYNSGTDSLFSRKITIEPAAGSLVELVVKSEVSWVERTTTRTIVVESHLFDWAQ